MSRKDYYEILEITKEASVDEIKRAYRALAKKYHPDKNPNDKLAEERFKDIQEAYDILNDPQKRSNYDQIRDAAERGYYFSGFEANDKYSDSIFDDFGGIGDLFSRIFDKGERARNNWQKPKRGSDISYELSVPFEKAITGWETVVSLSREEDCLTCRGTGARPGTNTQKCRECGGKGTINFIQNSTPIKQTCPKCYGKGVIIPTPCTTCNGSGHIQQMRRIPVTIPAGAENGMRIRVPGQGDVGVSGGSKGDLFITIRVKEHRFLKRKGHDIICEITIDFVQAIMGVAVMVSTVDGKIKLSVPPGTQPGTILRLKGQGIKKADGNKGDQLVKINISLPKNITEKQRDLLKQFQEE